jgi:Intracellular proteinase inhibitor/Copper amine oxidase N-terminal domain
MGRRLFASLFVVLASFGGVAAAADVPYTVLLDGRPLTGKMAGTSAILHGGVLFADVVVAVKTFSGLLTFADGGRTARLTVRGRTAFFTLGNRTAQVEGKSVTLEGAPFRLNGDYFVPIATVARLGRAKVTIDEKFHTASLTVRPADVPHAAPAPAASPTSALPAAQAVRLAASGTTDAHGALHARLDVTNLTASPYTLQFNSGARVRFVVQRGDAEVWNSSAGKMFVQTLGSQQLAPHETWTLSDTWDEFGAAGAGPYKLQARLLSNPPLDAPAVVLGGPRAAPAPSTT